MLAKELLVARQATGQIDSARGALCPPVSIRLREFRSDLPIDGHRFK